MEININLNQQKELRSSKKIYVLGSVFMLLLSVASIVAIAIEAKFLFVFHAIYFLGISIILYFNSKGRCALDLLGKSYFRMDDNGISCKMDLFNKNEVHLSWDEIQDIKLKLFEVRIKTNGAWISINLEKLSDDNLKLVKTSFEEFQKHHAEDTQLAETA